MTARFAGRVPSLCLGLLLLSAPLSAAQQPTPPAPSATPSPAPQKAIEDVSLEALLRTPLEAATKTHIVQLEAPQAVTVLTRAEIERSPARSLAELLRWVVGADVVRIQSSQNVLGTRGSNAFTPSKILILIDGQPIDPTLFSTTWWELVPVSIDDIERVEFIRSPGTIYGANAQNGVVNIITRKASTQGGDRDELSARASSGQQRMLHGYAGYLGRHGNVSYRLSAELNRIDAYQNPEQLHIVPGRPSRPGEQTFVDDKQMLDLQNYSGALEAKVGRTVLDATVGFKDIRSAEGRIPDRLCFVGLGGSLGYLNARWSVEAAGLRHRLTAGTSRIDYRFRRNDDVALLSPAEMTLTQTRLGYEAQRSWGGHNLLLGATYALESASNGSGERFLVDQRVSGEPTWTAVVQDEWTVREQDRVYVGGLYSDHYVAGAHFAPFAAWVHKLGDRHALRLASFTSYRNPGVFEHSMDYDQFTGASNKRSRLVSNRDLRAERTASVEAGYRAQPVDTLMLSADLYLSRVDNAIEWTLLGVDPLPVPRPRYQSQNTLDQTIRGAEAEMRWRVQSHWTIEGSFTATHVDNESQRPEYRGPADEGPQGVGQGRYGSRYVAPWTANALVSFDGGQLRASAHYQYAAAHTWQWPAWSAATGKETLDLKPVPAYGVLNAHLSVRLAQRFLLAFEGYNVLDERHTEWRGDESYFGRALWVTLGVDF